MPALSFRLLAGAWRLLCEVTGPYFWRGEIERKREREKENKDGNQWGIGNYRVMRLTLNRSLRRSG